MRIKEQDVKKRSTVGTHRKADYPFNNTNIFMMSISEIFFVRIMSALAVAIVLIS
jgi:hypothetical protein